MNQVSRDVGLCPIEGVRLGPHINVVYSRIDCCEGIHAQVNTFKTGILLLLLTGILMGVGALWGLGGVIVALVLSLILNFATYWWSDKIALKMARAKPVSEDEDRELHQIVEEQAYLARMPKPKLWIIHNDSPNAFATGRSPNHAAVAVTDGIRRLLTREELSAVIAHELAHVGNRDTLIMTIAAAIAGAITWIAIMARWSMIFGGFRGGGRGGQYGALIGIGGLLVIGIIMPIAATMIRLAISRSREFQADATGARTSGKPWALADALEKLDMGILRRPMKVNEAVSHLFIAHPFKAGFSAKMFATHPPMKERVSRLRNLRPY